MYTPAKTIGHQVLNLAEAIALKFRKVDLELAQASMTINKEAAIVEYVYQTYTEPVYDDDGNLIHDIGDFVLDENGNKIPELDENGLPVTIPVTIEQPVYDESGDPLYKTYPEDVLDADGNLLHSKGDFILDENGDKIPETKIVELTFETFSSLEIPDPDEWFKKLYHGDGYSDEGGITITREEWDAARQQLHSLEGLLKTHTHTDSDIFSENNFYEVFLNAFIGTSK